jgi:hypothetical protein
MLFLIESINNFLKLSDYFNIKIHIQNSFYLFIMQFLTFSYTVNEVMFTTKLIKNDILNPILKLCFCQNFYPISYLNVLFPL